MANLDTKVAPPLPAAARPVASAARDAILELKARIGKSVLGQDHLVESMLIGLLANGNLLIESLPGLAKTRAVKTLAKNLAADLSRVQFTPDLLPSDVTGAEIYVQTDKGGQFQFQGLNPVMSPPQANPLQRPVAR
jgi:MoxR-like ATPase